METPQSGRLLFCVLILISHWSSAADRESLIKELNSDQLETSTSAFNQLIDLGDPSVIPRLIEFIKAEEARVGAKVHSELWKSGRLGDDYGPSGEPGHQAMMASATLSYSLAKLGDPAVPYLIRAFSDKDFKISRIAGIALIRINSPATLPTLIKMLPPMHAELQVDAIKALETSNDPRVPKAMVRAFGKSSDPLVRWKMHDALIKYKIIPISPLLKILTNKKGHSSNLKRDTLAILMDRHERAVLPIIGDFVAHGTVLERELIAERLANFESKDSSRELILLLRDREPSVQIRALDSISKTHAVRAAAAVRKLRESSQNNVVKINATYVFKILTDKSEH